MKPAAYIKSYEELYNQINERLKVMRKPSRECFRDFMIRKLSYVYRAVTEELENLSKVLSDVESAGDFYKELFQVFTGYEAGSLAAKAKKYARVARNIYYEALGEFRRLSEDNGVGSSELFKRNAGRLLSLYKRLSRKVLLVKKYLVEVSKMPDVRGDYVVVIAGLPQVGKSTLLSKLTRAKPEIGNYPFTTKTLIAGHLEVDGFGKIVLLDSPGMLDSPIEEKNLIELKAVLAIKHLANHLLYVFAVYPHFYYTLEEQVRVFSQVTKLLEGKPVTVVLNKVDLLGLDQAEKVARVIKEYTGFEPLPVSALTGYNLELLKKVLIGAFMAGKKSQ